MFEHNNESPKRTYVWFFGLRLIFEEGKYVGWYNPRLRRIV